MTAGRIALTELRRLTAGRLPRLAVVALVLVPLLYGALYVYANWDPYGRLHNVPAAIVNSDAGAQSGAGTPSGPGEVHAGRKIVDQLKRSNSFDWHETNAADADAGVRDGRFTFAMVIPHDFSASLTSPSLSSQGNGRPQQAKISVITNDANNYLVGTIAGQVVGKVKEAVASETGTAAADQLLVGFDTIYDKTKEAADGANKLADGSGKLTDGVNAARDGSARLADGTQQLAVGAGRLQDGQRQLQAGAGQLADGTQRAVDGTAQLRDGSAQLSGGLGTLQSRTAQLPQQTRQLSDGANRVADGAARVANGNAQLAGKADAIGGIAQNFTTQLGQTREQIHQRLLQSGMSEAHAQQVLATLDQLNRPITDANGQLQSQIGQLDLLSNGSRQVADGARQVANGAQQLAGAAPALSGGISQAADGSRQLTNGLGQLSTGAQQLNTGAGQLKAGEDQAVAGSGQLAGGTSQLVDGSSRLASGTRDLATGSAQLTDGSRQLADGLGKGAEQIPHPNDQVREATAQTIGDPVRVDDSTQASAGNYGSGLAPFFLALALWVGGYVLFLLVKPLSARALASRASSVSVAVGGWLAAAALGIAQAVLLFVVAIFGLGIHAAHPWAVLGLMIVTSLSYIAFLHALNAMFGSVGKFLGLVLLIMQLISAGGTFPWQTTPAALHPLHRVLPMSYVTDALRHLLYGAGFAGVGTAFGVLGAYLVAGLLLATVAAYRQRAWTPAKLKPELVL